MGSSMDNISRRINHLPAHLLITTLFLLRQHFLLVVHYHSVSTYLAQWRSCASLTLSLSAMTPRPAAKLTFSRLSLRAPHRRALVELTDPPFRLFFRHGQTSVNPSRSLYIQECKHRDSEQTQRRGRRTLESLPSRSSDVSRLCHPTKKLHKQGDAYLNWNMS